MHIGCYALVCREKTRIKLRADTVLENFPLCCPKCKQEMLICAKQMKISVISEPAAQTQEPIARKIKYGGRFCHFGERCKMPIPFSLHLQGKGLLACIKPFPYKNGHTGRTIAFALCNAHAGFCRMGVCRVQQAGV